MSESQLNDVTEELELPSILKTESTLKISPTAGLLLAQAREEKGWSVQQVSEQLKLSQSQIVALESNQFQVLPTLVIVKGFVRAYAKLLKIDPTPIISLLPIDNHQIRLDDSLKPALSTPFIESKMSLLGRNETNRGYIWGAILLIALLSLFLIGQTTPFKNIIGQFFTLFQQGVETKNEAHKLPSNLIDAVKTPVATIPVKEINASSTTAPISVEQNIPVPVLKDASLTTPLNTTEKEQAATLDAKLVDANEKNALIFKFRQSSWIQIKTDKGIVLIEKLMQAGTEETIKVDQGLQVKIGNAAGVDAWLRGESLSITPVGGSNVVNLSLK